MVIETKILSDLATLPTRGSEWSAGVDLYAATDYDLEIRPGDTAKIDIGLSMAIPRGFFGAIFARSGLATKQGLRPANCVGVIDADYRGPIVVALHNDSQEVQIIPAKSRVAQLVVMHHEDLDFMPREELPETNRGKGGFGSTGIQ